MKKNSEKIEVEVTPSCGCVMCDLKFKPIEKDGRKLHVYDGFPDIECTKQIGPVTSSAF